MACDGRAGDCGLLGHWLWSHFTDPPDWVRIGGVWPLGDSPTVLVTALLAESSTAMLLPPEDRGTPRRVYTDLDFRLIVADMPGRFRLHERQRTQPAQSLACSTTCPSKSETLEI